MAFGSRINNWGRWRKVTQFLNPFGKEILISLTQGDFGPNGCRGFKPNSQKPKRRGLTGILEKGNFFGENGAQLGPLYITTAGG